MPKSPEPEGSPRLMTTSEIAAEHGVSRQSIHTYRRTGAFPQPVEGEGSTRPRFRADEVAAFFAANPKQPGKKRSSPNAPQGDLVTTATDQQAAALTATVDRALKSLRGGHHHLAPLTETAVTEVLVRALTPFVAAQRAAALREAADELNESEALRDLTDDHMHDVNAAANELRRMAVEAEAQDG